MAKAAEIEAGKLYGEKHPKSLTLLKGEALGVFNRCDVMAHSTRWKRRRELEV